MTNNFSRIKYEKFLLESNIQSVKFEYDATHTELPLQDPIIPLPLHEPQVLSANEPEPWQSGQSSILSDGNSSIR